MRVLESLVQCAGLCMVRENASEDGERKPSLLYGLASGTIVATVLNPYENSQNSVAANRCTALLDADCIVSRHRYWSRHTTDQVAIKDSNEASNVHFSSWVKSRDRCYLTRVFLQVSFY